ncbi:MAG TPA: molybdopterin cofactor-binding domain-containing protein, partial [Chloroflexota bacterium]|nr:molybdopterin cofactor-binding domain-containing protein [Chloroflexota bacterium]
HIREDGRVEVFTGKAEMGQNIRTSLAQAVAEELRISIDKIDMIMADTDRTPFDMGTFGSRTTPTMAPRLRKVGASARLLLLARAADRWRVPEAELTVADGKVLHPASQRAIDYGALTGGKRLTEHWSDDVPLTPAEQWTIDGQSVPKLAGKTMVTGQHHFPTDLSRPGMLVGKVLRPPTFGSTLARLNAARAEAMPEVTVVHQGDFVGVAAPDRATALSALESIEAEWQTVPQIAESDLFEYLRSHPSQPTGRQGFGGPAVSELGSLEAGRADADHQLAATYTVAFIAHAPLETRAALAEWNEDRLTVWTGTQRPFGVRSELAAAFQMPEDGVRVVVPDTGAAYGGKHTGDAALEAARLAKAAGRPVKIIWTREEEFTWAYFRPAGLIDVKSAVRADGTITAWEFHNYNSGDQAMLPPYAIANQKCEFHTTESPLRQGSYRALAATANHFARESHLDELADAVGIDPLAFRLKNLAEPRLSAVLEAAALHFGWQDRPRAPGHGFGIAGGTEKGSFVAACVEVVVDPASGRVELVKIVEAFDCGAVVNPSGLRNQIEGAVVQAIGGALFERIEFGHGKILNNRFSSYRVPRFADVPPIKAVLLNRPTEPSVGAGETPIVVVAPAIANAIFDATGRRVRSMPLAPNGVVDLG